MGQTRCVAGCDHLAGERVRPGSAPFSLFDVEKKDRILVATKNALGESGSFIVYQFLLSPGDRKQDIKRKLNQHMHIVNANYEMLCLPPIRIYQAVNGSLARQLKARMPSSQD
jgi:hypothetical protein